MTREQAGATSPEAAALQEAAANAESGREFLQEKAQEAVQAAASQQAQGAAGQAGAAEVTSAMEDLLDNATAQG